MKARGPGLALALGALVGSLVAAGCGKYGPPVRSIEVRPSAPAAAPEPRGPSGAPAPTAPERKKRSDSGSRAQPATP